MTERESTLNFLIRDTPPDDLVGTTLEKIWFLSKEIPYLR